VLLRKGIRVPCGGGVAGRGVDSSPVEALYISFFPLVERIAVSYVFLLCTVRRSKAFLGLRVYGERMFVSSNDDALTSQNKISLFCA
jgi:hypothetical protein